MSLAPKSRLPVPIAHVWRSWRVALWVVGGLLATGAARQYLPGGAAWGLVVMPVVTGAAMSSVADRDRRRQRQERLHHRAPRVADLDRAPAPDSDRRRRRLRTEAVAGVVGALLFVAAGVALFGLPSSEADRNGLPTWLAQLIGFGVAAMVGRDARRAWRALRRMDDAAGLPRSAVTVLGFDGPSPVVVPGVVHVPDLLQPREQAQDDDLPPAFVAPLGRGLGELVPGDVLACDGRLAEDAVVALATDERSVWTGRLRPKPWREIHEPSFRELLQRERDRDRVERQSG